MKRLIRSLAKVDMLTVLAMLAAGGCFLLVAVLPFIM